MVSTLSREPGGCRSIEAANLPDQGLGFREGFLEWVATELQDLHGGGQARGSMEDSALGGGDSLSRGVASCLIHSPLHARCCSCTHGGAW